MKSKKLSILLVISSLLFLVACNNNEKECEPCNCEETTPIVDPQEDPKEETPITPKFEITKKESKLYKGGEEGEIVSTEDINIYYEKDKDVPYLDLEDAAKVILRSRQGTTNNPNVKVSVSKDNKKGILTSELNSQAIFDFENNLITITEWTKFRCMNPLTHALDLRGEPEDKPMIKNRDSNSIYHNGEPITIDLKNYESINLIFSDDKMLIPSGLINDLFVTSISYNNLVVNDNGAFLIIYNTLGEENYMMGMQLDDGRKPICLKLEENILKDKTISKDLAKYNYDELCLGLDYNYGLKNRHKITSFDKLFEARGYKEGLLSTNTDTFDYNLSGFIYNELDDIHSAFLRRNYKASREEDLKMPTKTNIDYYEYTTEASLRRSKTLSFAPYEEYDDTAYITFSSFDRINDEKYKEGYDKNNNYKTDLGCLLAYSYNNIHNNKNIKNVVIDCSGNIGGSNISLCYALTFVAGNKLMNDDMYYSTLYMADAFTHAYGNIKISADLNYDGKIDQKDVPLAIDYNVTILTSRVSFSCGNALPCLAKRNNDAIRIVGTRSGGGTCSILPMATTTGTFYQISSPFTIGYVKNGEFNDFEDGQDLDYTIGYNEMYDRNTLTNRLRSLFN